MYTLGILFCVIAGVMIGWGNRDGKSFIIRIAIGVIAYASGVMITLAR